MALELLSQPRTATGTIRLSSVKVISWFIPCFVVQSAALEVAHASLEVL